MSDSSKNWIVESFNGVNIVTILVVVGGIAWTVFQIQSSSDTRMTVFEKTLIDLTEKFDDLETSIDIMRANDTRIAIIELNAKNISSFVDRNGTRIETLQEHFRDMQAEMRDLGRTKK